MLEREISRSGTRPNIKLDAAIESGDVFKRYKYLDKNATKKFILNQNWDLLQGWVSYNLKLKNPRTKKLL
jgi:hypothetical protein